MTTPRHDTFTVNTLPQANWQDLKKAKHCQFGDCGKAFIMVTMSKQKDHCHCCGLVCCLEKCLTKTCELPPTWPTAVSVCDRCYQKVAAKRIAFQKQQPAKAQASTVGSSAPATSAPVRPPVAPPQPPVVAQKTPPKTPPKSPVQPPLTLQQQQIAHEETNQAELHALTQGFKMRVLAFEDEIEALEKQLQDSKAKARGYEGELTHKEKEIAERDVKLSVAEKEIAEQKRQLAEQKSAAAASTSSSASSLDPRTRVVNIYKKYAPEKLANIDQVMTRYQGQEVDLIDALVQKYGPEPTPESATVTAPALSSRSSSVNATSNNNGDAPILETFDATRDDDEGEDPCTTISEPLKKIVETCAPAGQTPALIKKLEEQGLVTVNKVLRAGPGGLLTNCNMHQDAAFDINDGCIEYLNKRIDDVEKGGAKKGHDAAG